MKPEPISQEYYQTVVITKKTLRSVTKTNPYFSAIERLAEIISRRSLELEADGSVTSPTLVESMPTRWMWLEPLLKSGMGETVVASDAAVGTCATEGVIDSTRTDGTSTGAFAAFGITGTFSGTVALMLETGAFE